MANNVFLVKLLGSEKRLKSIGTPRSYKIVFITSFALIAFLPFLVFALRSLTENWTICSKGHQHRQRPNQYPKYFLNRVRYVNEEPPIDLAEITLPSESGGADLELVYFKLATQSEIRCPVWERVGNHGDGGWNVCKYGNYKPKESCIVYSFGINYNWSFDDGMVKRFKCVVRSFDPSMNTSDHVRNKSIVFLRAGLHGNDGFYEGRQMYTLKSILRLFKEENKIIDYLKLDIEGSEWLALESSISDGSLTNVKQLGFKMHTDDYMATHAIGKCLEILRLLRSRGFYRWFARKNPEAKMYFSNRLGVNVSCCHEVVYLNLNFL